MPSHHTPECRVVGIYVPGVTSGCSLPCDFNRFDWLEWNEIIRIQSWSCVPFQPIFKGFTYVQLEFWAPDAEQIGHIKLPSCFFCGGTVLVDSRTGGIATEAANALGSGVCFARMHSARHASQRAVLAIRVTPSRHV